MPDRTEPPTESTDAAVKRLLDQYTEIARLAGGLAHEIKNPLSTIRLNMQLLAEELEGLPPAAERRATKRMEAVQRECQRLHDLLDDFLNYAKVRRFDLKPVDLNREIQLTLEFFEPEAQQAGVEIITYFDAELPAVRLDREAFRGALLNLLINAKQAMPDGGQLVVQTRPYGTTAAVYLTDNGVGMDDRTAAQMFETFFSTKPGGSGLGLPTAAKIIEAHGGAIAVETELGRGTRFTIELPGVARIGGGGVMSDE
ncbi:Sensor protein ZraS [Pirellulimonas nuda]|uniref:histidine kinase n=1 Tax=Pirellulimonas nuda TaxID=2528009 RepID=A0A518D9G4_9BACT|nr:ATP-binding protein [Pirellulimonas nuda]QDU88076.1 Sensor protein ZraS [Pirellulimonas nuda]